MYAGRDEAASPATGNYRIHQEEEAAIVARALADATTGERGARGRARDQASA
jgi:hypothetical protein